MYRILQRYRLVRQIGNASNQTFIAVDEGQDPFVDCVVQQIWLRYHNLEELIEKTKLLQVVNSTQIPKVLAYFQFAENFYLVQEYIEGTNLNILLEQQGIFSEVQVWQILTAILPILQLIHRQNLIHGDIKPNNIIYKNINNLQFQPENLYLVDRASLITINNSNNIIIGSPEYSAEEQLEGKAVFSSDLYSLGVTCIYLLTHIPPFDLFDIANNQWVWRDYIQTPLSESLSKIIDKLIQKNVTNRFQTADEVMIAMGMAITTKTKQISTSSSEIIKIPVSSEINSLALAPDNQLLAVAHDNKTIALWDINTQQELHRVIAHTQAVKSVSFSPNGKFFASASDDKTIKIWNSNTYEEIYQLLGHKSAVKSVAFSPDGKYIASGSWDKTIKLWDVATGKETCTLTGHLLQVTAVAFSPDGSVLGSASFDRNIHLWKLPSSTNRPHTILQGHTWAVSTIAFSPNGNILASGGDDNVIKLWDINTGEKIGTIHGHSWSVTALQFTLTGEILISASSDKTIKLWQVSTLEEITTLSIHMATVTSLAIGFPDAQFMISGSRDKTISILDFRF